MKIAVIGFEGYVGSAIYGALKASQFSVIGVNRENYHSHKGEDFDVVINSAMPSGRFWAKNNPEQDFIETVKKTADLIYGWKYKKFIQVSTVSARCQLDTVYGRHKLAAEKICDFGENLIIRLGAVYSEKMEKGVLLDMLEGKTVYVDGKSRYSFISLSFVARWVVSHLDKKGIIELGGKNAVSLEEVAQYMGIKISFEGELNHQDIENPLPDLPEASEVLKFLDSIKK